MTGKLVWVMLVRAFTDSTTFRASGGIDTVHGATQNALLGLAGPFNFVFVLAGLIALAFIRGRANQQRKLA